MSYFSVVLADSPSAYWRLGEPSGTNANDEIGSNDGTYVNTPTLGVAGSIAGDADTAVTFTAASSEYATVPDNAALDLGDGPFSIEFWFKRTTSITNGYDRIVNKNYTAGTSYDVSFSGDAYGHRIALKDSGTGNMIAASLTQFVGETGVWHHIVITKNGTDRHVYVDGTDDTDPYFGLGANQTLVDGTDTLNIGRRSEGSRYFDGTLDELALYKSVLTPAQVAAHYAAAQPYVTAVRADTPTAYWRFGESSGTNANATIGNDDLTYVGSPALGVAGAGVGMGSDTAVALNGSTQYMTNASMATPGNVFSLEIWFKQTSIGVDRQLFRGGNGGTYISAYINSSNLLVVDNGTAAFFRSTETITDTTIWHHLVITKNGATRAAYLDGTALTNDRTDVTVTASTVFRVGASLAATLCWPGSLDDAAVYGSALSQSQVLAHYNAGKGIAAAEAGVTMVRSGLVA